MPTKKYNREEAETLLKSVGETLGTGEGGGAIDTDEERSSFLNTAFPVRRYTSSIENDEQSEMDDVPSFGEDDATKIRSQVAANMQGQIDAIEQVYAGLITSANREGENRLGRTRAISARGGLIGSPRGEAQRENTAAYNSEIVGNIKARMANEIAAVLDRIDTRANERIDEERTRIEGDREEYLAQLAKNRQEAREDAKILAQGGVQLDELDDADIQDLMKDTGYENPLLFEAYFNANKPAALQDEFQYMNIGGGRVVRFNKGKGGEPEVFELGAPEGDDWEFRMAGDTPIWINTRTRETQVVDGVESGNDFTGEDKNQISQAGLSNADKRTKDIFVNTPTKFRQEYVRNGFGNAEVTPEILIKNLEEWEANQEQGDSFEDLF